MQMKENFFEPIYLLVDIESNCSKDMLTYSSPYRIIGQNWFIKMAILKQLEVSLILLP